MNILYYEVFNSDKVIDVLGDGDTFWINKVKFFSYFNNKWNYNPYETDLIELFKYE